MKIRELKRVCRECLKPEYIVNNIDTHNDFYYCECGRVDVVGYDIEIITEVDHLFTLDNEMALPRELFGNNV